MSPLRPEFCYPRMLSIMWEPEKPSIRRTGDGREFAWALVNDIVGRTSVARQPCPDAACTDTDRIASPCTPTCRLAQGFGRPSGSLRLHRTAWPACFEPRRRTRCADEASNRAPVQPGDQAFVGLAVAGSQLGGHRTQSAA